VGGMNGEIRVALVFNSAKDGESVEDYPHGPAVGVTVDIEGASMLANFEVIEIVDDNNPFSLVMCILVW